VNVIRRLLTEGALNARWCRPGCAAHTDAAPVRRPLRGAVLGSVSAALVIVTLLLALFMPLVDRRTGPGCAGSDTLQLAVTDARLMLPYLAFGRTSGGDAGARQRGGPLRPDGVLAAAVQHRADRRDDRAGL